MPFTPSWSHSLCLDGILNPTVYAEGETVFALGRRCEEGPLLLCTVDPDVRHIAVIPQPSDVLLEDPRYIGVWEGQRYFVGADAYEYYHPPVNRSHRIYQAIFALDAAHNVVDVWRLPSLQPAEKNWVPLGEVDATGWVTLLHSHATGRCLRVNLAAHTATATTDYGVGEGVGGLSLSSSSAARAILSPRGGTPLLQLPSGHWWSCGHVVRKGSPGANRHPTRGSTNFPQYVATMHEYDARLRRVVREMEMPSLFGAQIEYACGACVTKRGVCVSLGWNDVSGVFLWSSDVDGWWGCATRAPGVPLPMPRRRLAYLDAHIPVPPVPVQTLAPPSVSRLPTLCLNMIVKNESQIIERLIATVIPIIDCYCICDTGSTDDTRERIRRRFEAAGVPGRVVRHPFLSFGHNRSFALRAAHDMADYVLLLDADMKLVIDTTFDKAALTADVYTLDQGNADFSYKNVRLLRTAIGATCIGSTHEYYSYPPTCHTAHLRSLRIDDVGDGGCKADKFHRDIRLLTADLRANPENERAHFYLANSYRDTGQWEKAVVHYQRRIELGGWHEEVWYSYYAMGQCHREVKDAPRAIHAWLAGYQLHPHRAENLFEIVKHYREGGQAELAARFYQWAVTIPPPAHDVLFVHHDVYRYRLAYEFTVFYYYLRNKAMFSPDAIYRAVYTVLAHDCEVANVLVNYKFYAPKLRDHPGARVELLPLPCAADMKASVASFVASTPSAARLASGEHVVNVRYNNTPLNERFQYVLAGTREITRNVWVRAHNDASSGKDGIRSVVMADDDLETDAACFAGRQDVRLLARDGHDGHEIHYTATVCVREAGEKVFRIEHGRYDLGARRLRGTVMRSPCNAECEKNWCLFHTATGSLRCVYSWHPLVLGRFEGEHFVEERRMDVPLLRVARGSSHGAVVRLGAAEAELWFMVHMVSYESPRRYYHAVVALDRDATRVLRVTYPFTFEGNPVEYSGDLHVNASERTFCVHYSVRDQGSRRVTAPLDALRWSSDEVVCRARSTR